MSYGELKIDTITFTAGGSDTSVSVSGLVQNPTFTGNITTTGTISGDIIRGNTISGVNVIGTTEVSGATVTGDVGLFGTITGGTHTLTSGVFASGTAANPSITFVGDLDTGLFTGAANTVSLAASGAAVLTVSGTNVGINTTNPGNALHVSSTASTPLKVQAASNTESFINFVNTNNGNGYIGYETAALTFYTSNTEKVRIDSDGRLLIGTTANLAPAGYQSKLQAAATDFTASLVLRREGNNDSSAVLHFVKTRSGSVGGNTSVNNGDSLGTIFFYAADGTDVDNLAASINCNVDGAPASDDVPGRLSFSTRAAGGASPTVRMLIDSEGNVGIGTTDPAAELDIVRTSANAEIHLDSSGGSGKEYQIRSLTNGRFAIGTTATNHILLIGDDTSLCSTAGKVGIGTTSPGTTLDVVGTARVSSVLTMGSYIQGTTQLDLYGDSSASTGVRLDSSGNLGIGNTSPSSFNNDMNDLVVGTGSGNRGITIYSGTSSTGNILFHDAANTSISGLVRYDHSNNAMSFWTNGTNQRLTIDSSGRVGIGATSPSFKTEIVDTLQADANLNYSLVVRGDDGGTVGESAQIFLSALNATTRGAAIAAVLKSGSNDHDLVFKTSGASATPSERVRIDSSGNVGIGGAPSTKLHIHSGGVLRIDNSGGTRKTQIFNDGTFSEWNADVDPIRINAVHSSAYIRFDVNGNERMRINSTGQITWANDDAILESINSNADARILGTAAGCNIYVQSNGQTGVYQSGTGWVSASSARLKNVVGSVDSEQCWDFVKGVNLYRYYFKEDPQEGVPYFGPMAEEIGQLDSEMLLETNQTDEQGPIYSFNLPLMEMKAFAALQTALSRIETLEAKVAALEAN